MTTQNIANQAILTNAVNYEIAAGFRVESHMSGQVVMVKPAQVNHILHAILTLLFLGLWVIVWLICMASSKEQRIILSVDDWGNLQRQAIR